MKELTEYLESRRIEGTLRDRLLEAEAAEAPLLSTLILELRPSGNTLRELLRLLDEVAHRDKTQTSAILANAEIQEILSSQGSRKEKQKRLRSALERLRYPALSDVYRSIESAQQELLREFGLRFETPEDLEGDQLTVTLSGRSGEEFKTLSEKLERAALHPAFENLLGLLVGKRERTL